MIDVNDLKNSFSTLLATETIVRRKKINIKNKKKIQFVSIIKKYDEVLVKSIMLQSQFNIDLSIYENPFYSIIDDMLLLSFGENVYKIIAFYFYSRIKMDGTENFLNNNGEHIYIRTPDQLYEAIEKLYPETFN